MGTDFEDGKIKAGIRSICELILEYGISAVTFAIGCCILFYSRLGISDEWRVFTALLLMFVGLGVKTLIYIRNHPASGSKRSVHIINDKLFKELLGKLGEDNIVGKPQTLSEEQKGEVVRILRNKLLTWTIIGFAILTGITGMSLWGIMLRVEAKMEKLVTKQFEVPQIKEVVRQAAAEQAAVLMTEQITPEVTKFKAEVASVLKELRAEIDSLIINLREEISQAFENLKKEQEKYATITLLNKLIIQATNGDKNAAIILADMSKNLDSEYSQMAKDAVRGTYEKYFGTKFSYGYFQPIIQDHEVIKRLDAENFLERKRAVGTIRKRKMYKQIPNLISRLKTETHLDVIGEIERTLNALLDTKIQSLNLEETADNYMNIWESKKNILLK